MALSLPGLSSTQITKILKTAFVAFEIKDGQLFGKRQDGSSVKILGATDLSVGSLDELDGGSP